MNEQDIVNKLKSDPRALKSVMQSQDGQALLNMLSGGNSAALVKQRQAASGDTAALSAMLSCTVQPTGRGAGTAAGKQASTVTESEDTAWTTSMKKLNALLSDPGSMAQIMQLAQQLSGSMGGENTPPSPPSPPQAVPPPAPLITIDPQVIAPNTCPCCRS